VTSVFTFTDTQESAGDYYKYVEVPQGYEITQVLLFTVDGTPIINTGTRLFTSGGGGSQGVFSRALVHYRIEAIEESLAVFIQLVCRKLYEYNDAPELT
jgi:hypothetical protein